MSDNHRFPHPIEAILFDLDGTLIETHNRWADTLARKLMPLNRVLPRLEVKPLARSLVMGIETPANYVIAFLERLGLGSQFFGLTDRIRRSKGLATRDCCELVAGSEALLESLYGRYKLAVVTTRARPEAQAFIRRMNWERFFPVLITRQDVFRLKPHPEPVRKAAAALGVAPQNCLFIGDTVMDILAARRAGAYAVGVLSGFGERYELERAGADLILNSAAELLHYLPILVR